MESFEDLLKVLRPPTEPAVLEGFLQQVEIIDHHGEAAAHPEAHNVSPLFLPVVEGRLEVHSNTEEASDQRQAGWAGREVLGQGVSAAVQ